MKRSRKLAGLVIAVAAAGSLATGLAVASTTTTTHPITLCVGKLGGNITAPGSNGQCSKLLQTAIQVASDSDVAALAARADAAEATILSQGQTIQSQGATISDHATRLQQAEGTINHLDQTLQLYGDTIGRQAAQLQQDEAAIKALENAVGGKLSFTAAADLPGTFSWRLVGSKLQPNSNVQVRNQGGSLVATVPVDSQGSLDYSGSGDCIQLPLAAAGTDVLGRVTANLTTAPGCP